MCHSQITPTQAFFSLFFKKFYICNIKKQQPHKVFYQNIFNNNKKPKSYYKQTGSVAKVKGHTTSSRALLVGKLAQGHFQISPAKKGTRPALSASEVRAAIILDRTGHL